MRNEVHGRKGVCTRMALDAEHEPQSLWSASADEGVDQESLSGLELAEAPTAPAHFEEQGDTFKAEEEPENPAPAARTQSDGEEAATATMTAARARGRGGRPRVTAEQDQRILEVFEKAKKEGRSLKEAAQQLAAELSQPAEYINQRYYYLQRRHQAPATVRATGTNRRRGARAAAQAPAPQPAAAPRRRGRAAAREAEPAPAPAPAAAAATANLGGVEQRLAELSDIATRQLAALTERIERIEERLRSLEQSPRRAAAVGDEELYTRLGRMLVRAAFGALESGR